MDMPQPDNEWHSTYQPWVTSNVYSCGCKWQLKTMGLRRQPARIPLREEGYRSNLLMVNRARLLLRNEGSMIISSYATLERSQLLG